MILVTEDPKPAPSATRPMCFPGAYDPSMILQGLPGRAGQTWSRAQGHPSKRICES